MHNISNRKNDFSHKKENVGDFLKKIVRSFGLIYLILGTLKFHGLLFPQKMMLEYLSMPNPIMFFLTNHTILALAAFIEMVVGVYLIVSKESLIILSGLLLWLVGVAFCYKLGLALVHYKGPCGCLLGINRFLPVSTAIQKSLSDIILIAALATSVVALLYSKFFEYLNKREI